jgi:hypothetical protein
MQREKTMAENKRNGKGTRAAHSRPSSASTGTEVCNYFNARASAGSVVLYFGIDPAKGKKPGEVQILHTIDLSLPMGRRVKDALVELFRKQDTPRIRITTEKVGSPNKKPGA